MARGFDVSVGGLRAKLRVVDSRGESLNRERRGALRACEAGRGGRFKCRHGGLDMLLTGGTDVGPQGVELVDERVGGRKSHIDVGRS